MRVAVTGAAGFLGSHVRLRLRMAGHEVVALTRQAATAAIPFDAVVHCAGINRGPDQTVCDGNIAAARWLVDLLNAGVASPKRIVYANSISAGDGSAYGIGKASAGQELAGWSVRNLAEFIDVRLPNLFGEGGRPNYNSFVATFAARAVAGNALAVHEDRQMQLVYVGDAARVLAKAATSGVLDASGVRGELVTVSEVAALIQRQVQLYVKGQMPSLEQRFEQSVFAMVRRHCGRIPFAIQPIHHVDARGHLYEGIRHSSCGQVFFSITHPGRSRGGHFHLRKFERFIVLAGIGQLICTDLLSGETSVDLLRPGIIADMWTCDTHSLLNVGDAPLLTAFWISEQLDEADPDTFRGDGLACEF
ncbi:MAG: polysaccharide biosynthesis C-terminal domain-containing protein [Mycobacteriales bacterium]